MAKSCKNQAKKYNEKLNTIPTSSSTYLLGGFSICVGMKGNFCDFKKFYQIEGGLERKGADSNSKEVVVFRAKHNIFQHIGQVKLG